MNLKTITRVVFFCIMLLSSSALASGDGVNGDNNLAGITALQEVEVRGEKIIVPTMQANETVYTGDRVTSKGLEIQGARATTSVSGALDLVSGINAESADSNGLGAEMNSVRIRGVRSNLGSLTVDGIPNYGGNPIGPRDYIYDMENFESVSVYKGAAPGDFGTGVGSRGGAIELKPDWAGEKSGFDIKQGIGSNDYVRSFIHLDSGSAPITDTRISGAYSFSNADKWRGPGKLGPRHNANINLVQPLGDMLDIKLWFNHNKLDQHLYRPLTYNETEDLDSNYYEDYNHKLSGSAAVDKNYYDYNRGTYRNNDFLSIIDFRPTDYLDFRLKPYYSSEDTKITEGVSTNGGMLRKRNRDIKRWGFMFETISEILGIDAVAGYHFESYDMDISTEKYAITASGPAYRGYGLSATSGTGYINSPYLKFADRMGAFSWQAGIKYFNFMDPASKGYRSGPGPDYHLIRAEDLDRDKTTYDIWLPSAGASWDLTDSMQIYGSYGRNFIRPYAYMPLINTYNANMAKFQDQGIKLQDLFDGYDFERSDNIDIGLRYNFKWFDISPALFFSWHRDLLVTVYDPRVDLNYQQNMGKARGYGLDLELNIYPMQNVTLFVNPTYTRLTYDEDISFNGSELDTEGRQVVDTPEWMLKTGVIYSVGGFEFVPVFRFTGKRYGDVEHREEIDASKVVDLRMSYTLKKILRSKEIKFSLELNNIFDEKYVAVIRGFDDTRAGSTSYYQGAPFSAIFNVVVSY